MSDAR